MVAIVFIGSICAWIARKLLAMHVGWLAAMDFPLLQLTAIGIALRLLNNQFNKLRSTKAFESGETGLSLEDSLAAPRTSIE